MTPDRDETLLREALQAGLHPAETDLWPAVAEALPAGQKRHDRRVRALRLAVCIGAPLLLAAGVLLGRVQFTNLRTNPRPSFAPENNTGYAIQYDQTAYALPKELLGSLQAHRRDEADAEGLAPMHSSFSGRNLPPTSGPGGRGYPSWAELTEDTGLPLLQSDLLDAGKPLDAIWLFPTWPTQLPDGWETWSSEALNAYINRINRSQTFPAGFSVEWQNETPQYLYPRRVDEIHDGYTIETQAYVLLATQDRPAGTSVSGHQIYYDKKAGLIWEVEEYTTPSGLVALLPVCTSNGNSSPWLNSSAFLEQDGILYHLDVTPYDGYGDIQDGGAAARAVLKEVLDSFTPAT